MPLPGCVNVRVDREVESGTLQQVWLPEESLG
jgi:hypothetical protein